MTMTKVGTAINLYNEGGIRAVIDQIRHNFLRGDWAPTTKRVIGKRLHHKLYMYDRLGYWPKIREPRTFNEKIMHRKLYTDNELFSVVEDKWVVREYVAERVGEAILPEVYHVTDNPSTIPFDSLPEEFVVKPTHMSGPIIIVDSDDVTHKREIIESCQSWLNQTYGQIKEEYWYDDIEPKIIIEERLHEDGQYVPKDYKVYVFHGRAEFISVYQDRFDESSLTKLNYHDRDWNHLNMKKGYKTGDGAKKPDKFDELISISEKLGKGFDFIRVDLYLTTETGIVFGELTVGEGSGGNPFVPQEFDYEFGSYW